MFLIIHVHLTPQLCGAETSGYPHVAQHLSNSGFLPAMDEWSLKFGCYQIPQEQASAVHLATLSFIRRRKKSLQAKTTEVSLCSRLYAGGQ